jgi:hypothetical protein
MSQTPRVNIRFENHNVSSSTPSLGISHIVARTTKGPFNDPSQLITSLTQFERLFGTEIVPDNSVSNIRRALSTGSQLRISRVKGANATQGIAVIPGGTINTSIQLEFVNGVNTVTVTAEIRTKEYGTPINDASKIYLGWLIDDAGADPATKTTTYTLKQSTLSTFTQDSIFDTTNFLTAGAVNGDPKWIDYGTLNSFFTNVPNIEFFNWSVVATGGISVTITSGEDLVNFIADTASSGWVVDVSIETASGVYTKITSNTPTKME